MRRIPLLVPAVGLAAAVSIPAGSLGLLGLASSRSAGAAANTAGASSSSAASSSGASSATSTTGSGSSSTGSAGSATKSATPAVPRIDLDCFDQNHLTDAQHPAGTDPIRCNWADGVKKGFASFQLSRQVAGSTTAAQVVFTSTDRDLRTFLDTTAAKGTKYVYSLKELDTTGTVIGQSKAITPSKSDDRDDKDAEKPMDAKQTDAKSEAKH